MTNFKKNNYKKSQTHINMTSFESIFKSNPKVVAATNRRTHCTMVGLKEEIKKILENQNNLLIFVIYRGVEQR